ncbi:MAG: hypothetical protein P4L84_13240 [Isosphaeraceae bacterium]|nr:hypothetical protein [Isosphaeraceae bacterium]
MVNPPEAAALVGSTLSVVAGGIGLFRPDKIAAILGIERPDLLCLVELRGLFGGMLTTLGISCLVLRHPYAYLVAGLGYLGLASAKVIALAVDRPPPGKVVPGLLVDASVGLLLAAGFWAERVH